MPGQARGFLDYTRSIGGDIAAAEFMNEPTMATMGGAPKGYDAAAFGRDFKLFASFARQAASGMRILGPGSVGETTAPDAMIHYGSEGVIATSDMLRQMGTDIDAFSYHHYGAASLRCAGTPGMPQTNADAALSEEWLARTDQTLAFYRNLRDEFAPGKPMWLTETADAACGGNPWASTFLDTFRYLDQLGRLAKQGVQVVIHNTLAASDYGLLDQKTLKPRPNYWGALLWRRLMGTTVLDFGVEIAEGRHVYAHCLRGVPGGVTLLVINNSQTKTVVEMPLESKRYTLSAEPLQNGDVDLNGVTLKVDASGDLPDDRGRGDRRRIGIFCTRHDHVSGDRGFRKFRLSRFVRKLGHPRQRRGLTADTLSAVVMRGLHARRGTSAARRARVADLVQDDPGGEEKAA